MTRRTVPRVAPPLGPAAFVRSLWRITHSRPAPPASLAGHPLLRILLRRRSTRRFDGCAIPADVIEAILEAGRLAPSTVNLQTWSFGSFTPEEWRAAGGGPIPFGAAHAIVICADLHRPRAVADAFPRSPLVAWTIAVFNAGLAAMGMTIAAEALGVSSVMLSESGRTGLLDVGPLRARFALPQQVVPLTTLVLGYRRGASPAMPPKLPRETVVFHGRYEEARPAVMQEWLRQMAAGYTATHLGSSFDAQLAVYRARIGQAEADLAACVFTETREVAAPATDGGRTPDGRAPQYFVRSDVKRSV